jgi:mannitol 2-dehydrogenase
MPRLATPALGRLDPRVSVPGYERRRVSVGWVHIGPGAFHRAHQAMYLDAYLGGTDDTTWGICTVGLLPGDTAVRDVLVEQEGLYTLLTVQPDGATDARVVGSIVRHLHAPDDPAAVLATLADPRTRVVSLTITEGGYGVDDSSGSFEPTDAATLADLGGAPLPSSAFGYLVAALAERRAARTPPFTVLSCDNIQNNGRVAKVAVTAFARHRDPELAAWVAEHVAFPSCMVDRITPATTEETREAARTFGIDDGWPVRAESFVQWVVEDSFVTGRPELERVGVQFVSDVVPYEKMKLRLLNASHQAMGYLGLLNGATYVHEVCRDPLFVEFLRGYMHHEAIPTLDPLPGVEVDAYCDHLLARFASAEIADTLARLVVDGSDRIEKFLLPVLAEQLRGGRRIERCALVLAAWSCFLQKEADLHPVDRRLPELQEAVDRERSAPGSFLDYRPVFGELGSDAGLRRAFVQSRAALLERGVRSALAASTLGATSAQPPRGPRASFGRDDAQRSSPR